MLMRIARNGALFALAGLFAASQAHARVGQVCLELPAGAGTVNAKIASGCLPTHPRYTGSFNVAVEAETATIRVDGGFEQVGESRIGTADCMGSQVIEESAKAAGPRRYSVLVNGRYVGALDASDTMFGMRAVQRCFASPSQVQLARPERMTTYLKSQFSDWIDEGPGKGSPIFSAATLGGLASQLLGNHPESKEGRQHASITISKAQWRRMGLQKPADRSFMAIRIEEHGYLDDSVSGRRTFAATKQAQDGSWRVTGLWRQFMCARGENAGQWTKEPCP